MSRNPIPHEMQKGDSEESPLRAPFLLDAELLTKVASSALRDSPMLLLTKHADSVLERVAAGIPQSSDGSV